MSAKNRDYDPMSEDGYDSKIPLHNDEAFQHGIQFNAKVKNKQNFILWVFLFIYLVYWFIGSTKTNKQS
jgi:hypothetical protein